MKRATVMKMSNRFSMACLVVVLCQPLSTVALNRVAAPGQNQVEPQSGSAADKSAGEVSPSGSTIGSLKPWKEEFERICAQTIIATSLTPMQLEVLIFDSDNLLKRLGKVEDPWAKIYIFRLKKCSDFFKFALELQDGKLQN